MTVTVYGIANCDTVRKARAWLDGRGTPYRFHDYRKDGVPHERLQRWIDALGWEGVLNRAGTTFRKLPDAERADLDRDCATALMTAQPAMIRRPIVAGDGILLVGFRPDAWSAALGEATD